MPETLGDVAEQVRSKNAGPFWLTLEAFLPDDRAYRKAEALITAGVIAALYHVEADAVQIFRIPELRVIKVSFRRPLPQGSPHDRDMHSGQQHVPLASLVLP